MLFQEEGVTITTMLTTHFTFSVAWPFTLQWNSISGATAPPTSGDLHFRADYVFFFFPSSKCYKCEFLPERRARLSCTRRKTNMKEFERKKNDFPPTSRPPQLYPHIYIKSKLKDLHCGCNNVLAFCNCAHGVFAHGLTDTPKSDSLEVG